MNASAAAEEEPAHTFNFMNQTHPELQSARELR